MAGEQFGGDGTGIQNEVTMIAGTAFAIIFNLPNLGGAR